MGAFPNSKIGFSSWLLQLISRIVVFPITLIAVISIQYLSDLSDLGTLWSPRLLDQTLTGSATGTNAGSMLACSIAIAGLAMLSKLPNLIPEVIFKFKPNGFGAAIGDNLSKNFIAKTGSNIGNSATSQAAKGGMETVAEWRGRNRKKRVTANAQSSGSENTDGGNI